MGTWLDCVYRLLYLEQLKYDIDYTNIPCQETCQQEITRPLARQMFQDEDYCIQHTEVTNRPKAPHYEGISNT